MPRRCQRAGRSGQATPSKHPGTSTGARTCGSSLVDLLLRPRFGLRTVLGGGANTEDGTGTLVSRAHAARRAIRPCPRCASAPVARGLGDGRFGARFTVDRSWRGQLPMDAPSPPRSTASSRGPARGHPRFAERFGDGSARRPRTGPPMAHAPGGEQAWPARPQRPGPPGVAGHATKWAM